MKQDLKVAEKNKFTKDDLNDFYMYEDFTRKNVDKKLVTPLMQSIEKLNRQNQDLLIESYLQVLRSKILRRLEEYKIGGKMANE